MYYAHVRMPNIPPCSLNEKRSVCLRTQLMRKEEKRETTYPDIFAYVSGFFFLA